MSSNATETRTPREPRAPGAFRRLLRGSRVLQGVAIVAFWGAGEALVRLTHAPFPGAIAGLLLLLALLALRLVDARDVERGAGFFLGEMLLFFVPAVVAVADHPEWLGPLGVKLLVAIVAGTLVVMLVTGLVVEACARAWAPDGRERRADS